MKDSYATIFKFAWGFLGSFTNRCLNALR